MDDTISRRMAIRWVKTECNPYGNPTLDFESGKKVIEHLEQMPSAQLGKWVKLYNGNYKCSVCGDRWRDDCDDVVKTFNYCPNCGAKME